MIREIFYGYTAIVVIQREQVFILEVVCSLFKDYAASRKLPGTSTAMLPDTPFHCGITSQICGRNNQHIF